MDILRNISKTIVLSSLFLYAGVATAATKDTKSIKPDACNPKPASCCVKSKPSIVPVNLGNENYTYELNFAGLALQPFANNLDYAAEALPFNYGFDTLPELSPSWVIPDISTNFHFGFDLGFKGIFHSANSCILLNWQWMHSSEDSASLIVDSINNMVGPFFEIGPDASAYKKSTGTVKFHFDEANLNYGTFVDFGKLLHVNLFTGIGFLYLKEDRTMTYSDLSETIVRKIEVPSKFIGAGPQLGFDFEYKIIKGFEFVGNTRASLFVGNFSNQTTYSTLSPALAILPGDPNPNIQTTSPYDKTGIVPGLEAKLGFAYEYVFRCDYFFKIEAGYQAQLYVNALRSTDLGSEVALNGAGSVGSATTGVYARTFQRTVSDFCLAGPYASINMAY